MKKQQNKRKPPTLVTSWRRLRLWPHQTDAVKMILRYLKSDSTGSALVRMPTGSGKTGIMAVVAQCIADRADVLIVAPWSQLTRQIVAEIGSEFWAKLGQRPKQATKETKAFLPSKIKAALKETQGKPTVFICTNQALERLRAENTEAYKSLRERISLVMVDEGHREPAPEWAKAVRELGRPTVLFSATPYRNDHRLFDIDSNFVYRLSHQQAVSERFIRDVKFIEVEFDENPKAFVKALLDYFKGDFQKRKPSKLTADRVIVRCETRNDIDRVAAELRKAGQKVVAVHETFRTNEEKALFRRVPSPSENDATFWVHQFKLIEGVDDPNFALLATYQPLGNARTLVQQVGRIVRNPSRAGNQVAHVFCHKRHKQRTWWQSYLRYEQRLGDRSHDLKRDEIFNDWQKLQEDYQYLDGNFREKFDIEASDFYQHLNYTLSANIYQPLAEFWFPELLKSIQRTIDEADFVISQKAEPDDQTVVFVYGRCNVSPLLIDQTFLESRLAFTIVRQVDGFIFYYDSEGLTPNYLQEYAARLKAAGLEQLLAGEKTRISQVSLLNSDLSRYSVRRRSLSAYSIMQLAPGLADYAHFCSTASGTIESAGSATRRYVGFTRARVSERSGRITEFDDYVRWTKSIAALLKKKQKQSAEFLNRYALNVEFPDDPCPVHILFDIEDVEPEYSPDERASPETLEAGSLSVPLFDDRCWDINESGEFICLRGPETYSATLRFDSKRRKFIISSPALEEAFPYNGAGEKRARNLVAHLNYTQSFRIVTDEGLIYAYSNFYQSQLPVFGRRLPDRIDLSRILLARPKLATTHTEKGGPGTASKDGWIRGSVFEYIDRRSGGLLATEKFDPDILICDDLGTELADFIAVQLDPPRVAMIHAKVGKSGESLSASAFHDVCGQAVKSLGILNPHLNQKPKELGGWDKPWDGSPIGIVGRRIREPKRGMTADKAWEKIERVIRHPSATREVWVVMGDGLSYDAFQKAQRKDKPPPHVIQLIYLLQSTWAAVSSVGAVFKVFCQP